MIFSYVRNRWNSKYIFDQLFYVRKGNNVYMLVSYLEAHITKILHRIIKNVVVTGNSDSRDNCRRKYRNVFDFVNKLKFEFIDDNEFSRDLNSIKNILSVAFKIIFYPKYKNYFKL